MSGTALRVVEPVQRVRVSLSGPPVVALFADALSADTLFADAQSAERDHAVGAGIDEFVAQPFQAR